MSIPLIYRVVRSIKVFYILLLLILSIIPNNTYKLTTLKTKSKKIISHRLLRYLNNCLWI